MASRRKKIESLQEQLRRLQAQQNEVKAQIKREEKEAEDERIRALGRYLDNEIREGREDPDRVWAGVDKLITRPQQRETLGLPPADGQDRQHNQHRRVARDKPDTPKDPDTHRQQD